MIDNDHFKNVNDTYGHQTGDAVLKELSRILEQHLRRSDYACRYGGEEMTLILTQTPLAGAMLTAERIRERIEKTPTSYNGQSIEVTVSIGVSEHSTGESRPEMIEKADKALYQAKHSGRNKVCTLQSED